MKAIKRILLATIGVLILLVLSSVLYQLSTPETKFVNASIKGDLEQVKKYLSQGIDVNLIDAYNEKSALMGASSSGHLKIVKYLIKSGSNISATNNEGETALMEASYNGHLDIVKYLVSEGADVNSADNGGFTSLMSASWSENLEVAEFLLSKGANINAKCCNNKLSIVFEAGRIEKVEVVRFLIKHGANLNESLHASAMVGDLKSVKLLLEKGANLNSLDRQGHTPLIMASWRGHINVAEYLIQKGADINVKDFSGSTALDRARYWETSRFLKSHGAKKGANL